MCHRLAYIGPKSLSRRPFPFIEPFYVLQGTALREMSGSVIGEECSKHALGTGEFWSKLACCRLQLLGPAFACRIAEALQAAKHEAFHLDLLCFDPSLQHLFLRANQDRASSIGSMLRRCHIERLAHPGLSRVQSMIYCYELQGISVHECYKSQAALVVQSIIIKTQYGNVDREISRQTAALVIKGVLEAPFTLDFSWNIIKLPPKPSAIV